MDQKQQGKCGIGDPVYVYSKAYYIGDTVHDKLNPDVRIRIEWYLTLFRTIPDSGEILIMSIVAG